MVQVSPCLSAAVCEREEAEAQPRGIGREQLVSSSTRRQRRQGTRKSFCGRAIADVDLSYGGRFSELEPLRSGA